MKNSYLHMLIKKLERKEGNIIYSEDLKLIIKKLMHYAYSDTKAYKLIYYMKNKGYIVSLKKDIFYITSPDLDFDEHQVIQTQYRNILYRHCKQSLQYKRYIGGKKALELHYENFEVPENILIVNEKKQSKEMVLALQSIQFKKYTAQGKNLFSKFKKHTKQIKIGKYKIHIASKELALLECMYNYDSTFDASTKIFVKKVIKRNKQYDIPSIVQILKLGKHHTSINRLYKIALENNKKLASDLGYIIKRYSFFIDS